MNKLLFTLLFAGAGLSASMAVSAAAMDMNMDMTSSPAAHQDAPTAAMTEGVVEKVEKDTNEITIKHGPIKNVGMAAMTMSYPVADPMLLDDVKEGEKILFTVKKISGEITVTKIDVAR